MFGNTVFKAALKASGLTRSTHSGSTPASSEHPAITASLAYGNQPHSAHEKLELQIAAGDRLTLRLSVAGQSFVKQVTASDAPRSLWIGIHRHLLPEGRHTLLCEAFDGNVSFWQWQGDVIVPPLNGLGLQVRDGLARRKVPAIFEGPLDSSFYDYADPTLWPWFDRPDAASHIAHRLAIGAIDQPQSDQLQSFIENGFFLVRGLLEPELLHGILADVDQAAKDGYDGFTAGSSKRMHHLHHKSRALARLWRHPVIMEKLRMVFEVEARPCQTLTFVNGSQQGAHQDTVHLTPFPAGYMMGVWVALEDVRPGSGELFYFPGSHRTPRLYAYHGGWPALFGGVKERPGHESFGRLCRSVHEGFDRLAADYPRVDYLPKAGDVLFWHENLIHGGAERSNPDLTRKSVAMHYFAEGSLAYYDSWGEPGYMAPSQE